MAAIHSISCGKNPKHEDFIPVNKFSIQHLPQNHHRDFNLLGFLKHLMNLTVCIQVVGVSENRPDKPYPFHECRGNAKIKLKGTGSVFYVKNYTVENGKNGCICKDCENSPVKKWTHVRIRTARHVVFDNTEAKQTKCMLFYDSDDQMDTVKELQGVSVIPGDIDSDWVLLECVTHDMDLGRELKQISDHFHESGVEHMLNFPEMLKDDPLAVVVSHPHGCSKQITVGKYRKKTKLAGAKTHYDYTAQTCPCSSGAPVYLSGTSPLSWVHVHSGYGDEKKFNMSGIWFE